MLEPKKPKCFIEQVLQELHVDATKNNRCKDITTINHLFRQLNDVDYESERFR